MKLKKFAGLRKPAYKSLLVEFFCTFSMLEGCVLKFSIRGVRHQFPPAAIEEAFSFDESYSLEGEPRFPQFQFWSSIATPGTSKFSASAIISDELFEVYSYVSRAFLGKSEATIITISELYLLWATVQGREDLTKAYAFLPLAFSQMQGRGKRKSALAHGIFVTTLAERFGWRLGHNEEVYLPRPFSLQRQEGTSHRVRTLGQPSRPVRPDSDAEREAEAEAYDRAERGDDRWEQFTQEYEQAVPEQPEAWRDNWSGTGASMG